MENENKELKVALVNYYQLDKGYIDREAHSSFGIEFEKHGTKEEILKELKYLIAVENDSNYYYEINYFEDEEFEDTKLTIHSIEAIELLERENVLGSFIRERRLLHGFTQSQLAELIDVDIRLIQHWEAGTRNPDGKNTLSLIRVLELNIKEVEKAVK